MRLQALLSLLDGAAYVRCPAGGHGAVGCTRWLGLAAVATLLLVAAGCPAPPPMATTTPARPAPPPTLAAVTATPRPALQTVATPAVTGTPAAGFGFKNAFLSLSYDAAWRISGKSDDSMTLTHKEAPGQVLLSVRWLAMPAAQAGDVQALYEEKLKTMATETKKLEDVRIGGVVANRYASAMKTGGSEVVSLNVFLSSAKTMYFVTFAGERDRFVKYAQQANTVIDTLRIAQ